MSHFKRSAPFNNQMAILAMKMLGVHDKSDLKQAAKLLTENTTDSGCVVLAKSDEPIFTLRAKDPVAVVALERWISEAERRGLHMDKIMDARECLKQFKEYKPS